jgi:hypothetical protein
LSLQRRQEAEARAREDIEKQEPPPGGESKSKDMSKADDDPKHSYELLQKKMNKVNKMLREVIKEKGEDCKDYKKLQKRRDEYLLALEEFECSDDNEEVSDDEEHIDEEIVDEEYIKDQVRNRDAYFGQENFEEPEWEVSEKEFDEEEVAIIEEEERERKEQQFIETREKAKIVMAKAQEGKGRLAAARKTRRVEGGKRRGREARA